MPVMADRIVNALMSVPIQVLGMIPAATIALGGALAGALIQRSIHQRDNPPARVRPHIVAWRTSQNGVELAFDLWNVGKKGTSKWTKLEVRIRPHDIPWKFEQEDEFVTVRTSAHDKGDRRFTLVKSTVAHEVKGRLCPGDHELYFRARGDVPDRRHEMDVRIVGDGMEEWRKTFPLETAMLNGIPVSKCQVLFSGKPDTELGKPLVTITD